MMGIAEHATEVVQVLLISCLWLCEGLTWRCQQHVSCRPPETARSALRASCSCPSLQPWVASHGADAYSCSSGQPNANSKAYKVLEGPFEWKKMSSTQLCFFLKILYWRVEGTLKGSEETHSPPFSELPAPQTWYRVPEVFMDQSMSFSTRWLQCQNLPSQHMCEYSNPGLLACFTLYDRERSMFTQPQGAM